MTKSFLCLPPRFRAAMALASLLIGSSALVAQTPPQQGSTAKPQGTLLFGAREHSFGSLVAGDDAAYDFGFEVTGDAPVTISRVHSSCGCTVPILEIGGAPYEFGTALPVGAKGFVRARVKSYDFVGAKSSQITVYSDAVENSVVLTISSLVRRFFVTEPEYLNLGEVLQGEKRTMTVKARTAEVAEFAIEQWGGARARREVPIETTGKPKITEKEIRERELEDALGLEDRPEPIAVALTRTAPNEWSIEVELDATKTEVGAFLHTLRFLTDGNRAFDLRVQGVILPLVGTQPAQRLAFGLMRQGTVIEKNLVLVDYDPAVEVKLIGVEKISSSVSEHIELGALPTTTVPDAEGRPTWSIPLKTRASMPKGGFTAKVLIRTDHPRYPELEVEVSGFVR